MKSKKCVARSVGWIAASKRRERMGRDREKGEAGERNHRVTERDARE